MLQGDCVERMRELPSRSVHCVVTSPPYWQLRDYGCDGQFGLEDTIGEYVDNVVAVFREVRRVLRPDGTLWLNMGDTYIGPRSGARDPVAWPKQSRNDHTPSHDKPTSGLPNKSLAGIPWRVALALQADGWLLRSDVIWHKPNPMPESATDRPTKAHEYVFLFSRSNRYHYDAKAIAEPVTGNAHGRGHGVNPKAKKQPSGWDRSKGNHHERVGRYPKSKQNESFSSSISGLVERKNKRTVWTIPPQPMPEAHFATFPERLAEICIAAGTSGGGACSMCGVPYVRAQADMWRRGCRCVMGGVVSCTVMDPFMGSGTVAVVAERMGLNWIGIELNPESIAIAETRLESNTQAEALP